MAQQSAPGSCADCGNDAYIRLAATNGAPEMVCAHCFAERVRSGAVKPETAHTKSALRTEQDHRIHR
jgi:ribosomal protein L37AE/L43A